MLDRFLREPQPATGCRDATGAGELFPTFHALDSRAGVPSLEAVCGGVLAQSGLCAVLLDRPAAALLLGAGLVILAQRSKQFREETWAEVEAYKPRRSGRRAALALLTVIICLLASLWLRRLGGGDGAQPGFPGTHLEEARARNASDGLGGTYRGVILLTDPPTQAPIPPHALLRRDMFAHAAADPLSIPFFGVYWVFRWPQTQPPPGSLVTKSSPLKSAFRSSDRFALSMEARQNFGTLIDLACCSQIQLA